MKITKRQLKRIIKEEFAMVQEYGGDGAPASYSATAEEELVEAIEQAEKVIGEEGVQTILERLGYLR